MSTTSTIYASKDTWLDGENTSANNSGDDYIRLGQQTVAPATEGERANGIFAFDVSALTPSLLTQVNFKLNYKSGAKGAGVRQCYVYRLARDFVEDEATWLVSATGTDWTAADGGASDIATTEPYATFDVGFRTDGDVSVDITKLVVDAINRRSGTLYLWVGIPLSDTATSRASGQYHSLEAGSAVDRPRLECITADRIVWDGSAGDGNAQTASNYVGDVAPDWYDHVIFNDGAVNVTNGYIYCNSLFISEEYTGTIQETDGSAVFVLSYGNAGYPQTNKIVINQKRGRFNLRVYNVEWKINIANCPSDGGRLYTLMTDSMETTVIKTTGRLELDGDFVLSATGNKHSKSIETSGNPTKIKALKTKLFVTNGSKDFVLGEGSKMYATGGNLAQTLDSYITDNSYVSFLSKNIDASIHLLSGKLSFKDNENASIETEDIILWKNGTFDPRTNVGAWNPNADLDFRGGGKFVVDVGRTLTIT